MSEMVRRVAMVIDQGIMMDDDSDDIARAVIEAMREPTVAIKSVSTKSIDYSASEIWEEMIKAALK